MSLRWKLIVSLVGIFLLGSLTGVLCTLHFRPLLPLGKAAVKGGPEQWGPLQLRQFIYRLDLAPDQVDPIKLIIDDAMIDMRKLQFNTRLETARVLDKMETQIEPLLTPDQLKKLRVVQEEKRTRIRRALEERTKEIREREGK